MALVAHWKLDDNAASTTVVATVGTDATLVGGDNTSAKATTGPGGSITAAFDLNGTDDGVDISASGLSFPGKSIGIWAKFDAATGVMIGGGSSDTRWKMEKTDDTTVITARSGQTATFTTPSLGTSDWHFFLWCDVGGGDQRLFIDGVESSSGAQSPSQVTSALSAIGYNSSKFDGKLAWVKIFDSDESANVADLYAEGVDAGGVSTPEPPSVLPGGGIAEIAWPVWGQSFRF